MNGELKIEDLVLGSGKAAVKGALITTQYTGTLEDGTVFDSSWERGSNENVNGMIRRKHPKGTDFSKVTPEEIAATEAWINNYPRKIHGYKSAAAMFRQCLRELGLTA